MPIKFRCQFCEQFLGISRSRAGATVNCPHCDRAVRVPESDKKTRTETSAAVSRTEDDSLLSALTALSSLEEPGVPDRLQAPAAVPFSVSSLGDVSQSRSFVESQLIDPSTEVSGALVEPEYSAEPVALSDSLAELASLDAHQGAEQTGVVFPDLLEDMKSTRQSVWRSAPAILFFLCTPLVGLAGGWWLAKSELVDLSLPFPWLNRVSSSLPQDSRSQAGFADGATNGTIPVLVTGAEKVLQGTIQYRSPAGQLLPDSGAMVLLLPVTRVGTLLFDAESLRQPKGHPDATVTLAALNALGGKVVRASPDGLFAISHQAHVDCSMIVISEHMQRPDGESVLPDVDRLLQNYFESPSQICRQLAVQFAVVNDSNTFDFEFEAQ